MAKKKKKRKPPSPQQVLRRERLKLLVDEAGSHGELASRCGFKEVQYISQMLTGFRGISDESAVKLQVGMRKPRGWMDIAIDEVREPVAQWMPEPHETDILRKLLDLPAEMQKGFALAISSAHELYEQLEEATKEPA